MADRNFIIKRGLEVPLIAGEDGNTAITMTSVGNITVAGDLRINGNDIINSNGTTSIQMTNDATGNVTVVGDLFVAGNGIFSNGGYENLNFPLNTTNVKVIGDLIVGNIIRAESSEDVADAGAMLLTKAVSYFSTGATGETATLAAGSAGQFKSMMMVADGGGDMVVTVTNAGWKTSGTGTITFDAIGESCLLQYINSKWFAVGVNGVVFA